MITSLFRKSTPLNYSLVIIGVLLGFYIIQIHLNLGDITGFVFIKDILLLTIIYASLFTTNFITKKNGLSKDSAFTVLFYFLFLLFFPSIWNDFNLLISNFFILLALRRLLSMHSAKAPKEKIFDASLWIFFATFFHFWSILFILLVFISILFNTARDYRNWILPFIAFFVAATIFVLAALFFETNWISILFENMKINYKIDYFENNYQNLALSIYTTIALFFLVSMIFSLSKRALILQSSFNKIIAAIIIGIFIFIISPHKSNDILIYTIAPLSIMATSHIEMTKVKLQREIILGVLIICSFFVFFSQL